VLIEFLEFFKIFRNHSCKGALAIFMASATVGRILQRFFVNRQDDRIKIPDEIDWMMKYFALRSFIFVFSFVFIR